MSCASGFVNISFRDLERRNFRSAYQRELTRSFLHGRFFYRRSLTFVPRGFSSTSLEKGMQRPPAFSTLTSARGENLKAAMVNFSFGSPEPRTLPGTAMTSPPLRFLETWPRFRTILVLRDLPRKLAMVIQSGVWYCFPAFIR